MSKYFRWAELPPREDIDVWEGTTRWGNHDLYPIPEKERKYGMLGFYSYYGSTGISVFGFTAASAYVAAGLSCWDTVAAIFFGACIAAISSFFGSRPGVDMSLGYTMMTRVTFGLWGAFLSLTIVLIANTVFAGITAFYGGQAITIILGAVIPAFHHLPNTLPLSAGVTTQNLIGFFLYFLFYLPIIYWVPLFRLKRFLYPSIFITSVTFLGLLGWAVHRNGGTGPLIASHIKLSQLQRAFLFLQCTTSTAAAWGGSGDRLSDWTRFGTSRYSSFIPVLTGLPITLTLTAIVGALTTSAFFQMYGQVIWTPLGMLIHVQQVEYTPLCRAATFFAGIGLLSSMIYVNIVQNTVAFGMDIAGMMPKYVSMKRGALILAILSIAINPWRFLTQSTIFITVLSTFAVFSSVTSPTLAADYWLVRKKAWKIPDLYHENGIYWYTHGWNLRSLTSWCLAILPSLPGAVHSVMGGDHLLGLDYKIYQMTYFVGMPLSILFYVTICKMFPPPGLGIAEGLEVYDVGIKEVEIDEGVIVSSGSESKFASDVEIQARSVDEIDSL